MLKNPLHDIFSAHGAEFEEQAGYAVALRVSGLEAERVAIRQNVGVWEHSDMGKIRVAGDGARDTLNRTVTGDIEGLPENAIRYTLILDDAGGVISDVQIYNNFDEYMVTCPASARDRVLQALQSAEGEVEIEDITDKFAAICIEGPQAWRKPAALAKLDVASLRLLTFSEFEIEGAKAILSRIGYVGEYGFIAFVPRELAAEALSRLQKHSPAPVLCGREIQDLLRLEVRGLNLTKDRPGGETPLEAGLHWMIDFRKGDFPGRDAVVAERDRGLAQKLVAFEFASEGRGSALRTVCDGGDPVGYVANFDYSPARGRTIGLAYLAEQYGWPGLDLHVETAEGLAPVRTVSAPFVHTESNKIRIS